MITPGLLLVQSVPRLGSTMATLAASSLHLRWLDSVSLKVLNIVKNSYVVCLSSEQSKSKQTTQKMTLFNKYTVLVLVLQTYNICATQMM